MPGDDAGQFKVFVSMVDLAAFPPPVARLIEQDCATQSDAMDFSPLRALIDKVRRDDRLEIGRASCRERVYSSV